MRVPAVLTIGHSNRSLQDFISTLNFYNVEKIVDVRTIPRSRNNPQFNLQTLPEKLRKSGIGYVHMAGLGGLRHARKDSLNTGWRNASFRGFADYMQTDEFEKSLMELSDLAKHKRVCLMCAEVLPWRCHRSLIADALTVRGIQVEHIFNIKSCRPHAITPFARIKGVRISYPQDILLTKPLP
ncbi:MAG: DUF488 family protein [Deltaproteobacteria bacterium]